MRTTVAVARKSVGPWFGSAGPRPGMTTVSDPKRDKSGFVKIERPRRLTSSASVLSSKLTRSEEHTSELQSPCNLVCRLLLEKKKNTPQLQSPCNLVRPLLPPKTHHPFRVHTP